MQKIEQVRSVETTDAPVAPASERVNDPAIIAARVIWFIAGVIIALLAIRFVLILLGANQSSGFVNFVYGISYPFAAPFFGIFNYQLAYGVSRVEVSSLVAIAVYALIAYGLARLVTIRRTLKTVE